MSLSYPPLKLLLMAEIRRSPNEVGSLSHCLQGLMHPRWLAGFLNHQQCYKVVEAMEKQLFH